MARSGTSGSYASAEDDDSQFLAPLHMRSELFGWTWGALAAVTVGHGPPVGLVEAGAALVRLPSTADDPGRAFRGDGAGLPGPVGMWGASSSWS